MRFRMQSCVSNSFLLAFQVLLLLRLEERSSLFAPAWCRRRPRCHGSWCSLLVGGITGSGLRMSPWFALEVRDSARASGLM